MDYAYSLYLHPSDRSMSDMDILIPVEKAGSACAILRSAEFRCCSAGIGLFTSGITGEAKFTRGGILLELHTHPLYYPSLLPGRIPAVSEFNETRMVGENPAPGWVESFLYTAIHHSASQVLKEWQRRDVSLLAGKMNRSMWEKFAFLSVRSGWGGRIADVLVDCESGAPEKVVRCLRSPQARQDIRRIRGTAGALRTLKGWKQLGFAWALFYRILSGDQSRRKG